MPLSAPPTQARAILGQETAGSLPAEGGRAQAGVPWVGRSCQPPFGFAVACERILCSSICVARGWKQKVNVCQIFNGSLMLRQTRGVRVGSSLQAKKNMKHDIDAPWQKPCFAQLKDGGIHRISRILSAAADHQERAMEAGRIA